MESDLISWLRSRLPSHPLLRLGPGDDAALLRVGEGSDCVVAVDMLMDTVDFVLGEIDARRAGHKTLAVNLSDMAAMAARPLGVVVALALPRNGGLALAQSLYEGMLPLAERHQVAIAGGDTNSWDGPLVISVTVIGAVPESGVLLRDGAQPGDRIVVTGTFGGSILGHHLDFEPRVDEALLLNERYKVHACIDASDSLAVDLNHIAVESRLGAVVQTAAIPTSKAAHELAETAGDGRTALEHALEDGEDFELILAVPPVEAAKMLDEQPLDVSLSDIGRFVEKRGLWQSNADGNTSELAPRGYEHRLEP